MTHSATTEPVRHSAGPRSSPRRSSKRVALFFAAAALVLVGASAGAPAALYVVYEQRFGITAAGLTGSLAIYIGSAALGLLMMGRLSNHIGRRAVSLLSLAFGVAGLLVLADVHSLGFLLLGRALQGIGTGLALSAVSAYIVDLDPPQPNGSPGRFATAITTGGPTAGVGLGALGSGALVLYGPDPMSFVYFVFAAALIVCFIGIIFAPETSPMVPGTARSFIPKIHVPTTVRELFVGASAVFIACWALAGFYQALGPSVGANELGHSGSLFGGLTVAALVFPSAFGGPITARLKPRTAMVSGSTVLGLAVVAILASLNAHSTAGFLIASVIAGLAFGSAFGGAMRLLVGGLAPTDRAGLLSAIYLFSYLGAAVPAFISGLLVASLGLPVVVDGFGALVIVLVIVAIVIVLLAGRTGQQKHHHVSP